MTARKPILHRSVLIPAAVFLFILPFNHTVALRLTSLLLAGLVAVFVWRRDPPPPVPFKLPLLLWSGIAVASLLWTIDPDYSLGEVKNEIGYAIAAFLVFYGLAGSDLEWTLWNRVLVAGFLAMLGLAVSGYVSHGRESWLVESFHGGVGTFSTYLVTIFPFVFLTAIRGVRRGFPGNLVLLVIPLLFGAAALTLNRAVWPALIAEICVFGSFCLMRSPLSAGRKKLALAAVLLLVLLAGYQFMGVVRQKAPAGMPVTEALAGMAKNDERLKVWAHAWAKIADKPAAGYGFGRGILRKDFQSEFDNRLLWHAHNLVLNYALELGIGGVFVILFLFFAVGREYWGLSNAADPELRLVGIAGLTLVVGVFLKNMTDDFFVRDNALLFWALVGLSLGYARRRSLAGPATVSG
ncbi:MAG: O-antigen ligase family protein [Betaproteobacteria bacterium]|nr:O-antigen ligase family protein [Betaproteobacteria bacterium]